MILPARIHYAPHSQLSASIHQDAARFRVLDIGRRWGKTYFLAAEALQLIMDVRAKHNRAARVWVVSPTYNLTVEFMRHAQIILPEAVKPDGFKRSEKKIVLHDGSEIELKSADSADEVLRGAGLDAALFDEAARISPDAWGLGIRPALADRQGRAIFCSTPKGKNWFHDLYLLGQPQGDPDWKSWKLPSNASPLFPQSEFEALRRTMPETAFRQEILAEFLDDSGTVFRGIQHCVGGTFQAPIDRHDYLMGVDVARTHDFTVITVLDLVTRHVVAWDRFNNLDWPFQKEKIISWAKKYNNAMIWLDSTGVGDAVLQDLQRLGVSVNGYKFSNESKKELIEFAVICVEQKLLTFPRIDQLIFEMESFDYEILPSGNVRYSAPCGENFFDDCVISFSLMCMGAKSFLYDPMKEVEGKPWDHLPLKDAMRWDIIMDGNATEIKDRERRELLESL
jgi:hypothetical protein